MIADVVIVFAVVALGVLAAIWRSRQDKAATDAAENTTEGWRHPVKSFRFRVTIDGVPISVRSVQVLNGRIKLAGPVYLHRRSLEKVIRDATTRTVEEARAGVVTILEVALLGSEWETVETLRYRVNRVHDVQLSELDAESEAAVLQTVELDVIPEGGSMHPPGRGYSLPIRKEDAVVVKFHPPPSGS